MGNTGSRDGSSPDDAAKERRRRQAEALRQNLNRRKAQKRARDGSSAKGSHSPAPTGRDRS